MRGTWRITEEGKGKKDGQRQKQRKKGNSRGNVERRRKCLNEKRTSEKFT